MDKSNIVEGRRKRVPSAWAQEADTNHKDLTRDVQHHAVNTVSHQLSPIIEADELVQAGVELINEDGVDKLYIQGDDDGMDEPTSNDDEVTVTGKRKKGIKKSVTSKKMDCIKSMYFIQCINCQSEAISL